MMVSPRCGGVACALLSVVMVAGCNTRANVAPQTVDGVTYGVTREPFRSRWWHYYERGVSWANGGFWAEAEADLQRCLALRRTDARRARTYGMHFVQCFAHRELGAVLIEQGRLDEAEAALTVSLAQEPSAKAVFLLRRIHQMRDQDTQTVDHRPLVIDPAAPHFAQHVAQPAAQPVAQSVTQGRVAPPDLAAVDSRIVLDAIDMEDDAETTVRGRFTAPAGTPLWLVSPAGETTPITLASDGTFTSTMPIGGSLACGGTATADDAQPVHVLMTIAVPAAQPTLTLEGPADDATVQSSPVWFRFRADAPRGLRTLVVRDDSGHQCAALDLSGQQTGGMLSVDLDDGAHELHFVLSDADGRETTETRRLNVVPAPEQDGRWRAPALLVALQPSGMGQNIRPSDPLLYERSLVHDGRFNLIAPEGAALRQRELAWAQAGLVTPTTAVHAGRAAQVRYVLLGTLTRGRDDAECFVRLVNCVTGHVVATADTYARASDDFSTQAFFVALTGRLRQAFPIHRSRITADDRRLRIDLGTADGVETGLRFYVLDEDQVSDAGLIEIVASRAHDSDVRWVHPRPLEGAVSTDPLPDLSVSALAISE